MDQSTWISVKDTPPALYRNVIIARRGGRGRPITVDTGMLTSNGSWKIYGAYVSPKSVLYWMPMPEPPEGR